MTVSLVVFLAAYVCFVVFPGHRSWVACGGALLLVVSKVVTPTEALLEKVNWNVMGLFLGTLVLAELFLASRAPSVFSGWLVSRCRSGRAAMVMVCALSGFISIFVENVAVVLLVAPVALSLAEQLKANPIRLLIGIAICSNVQGAATMIGDPPSMILAGAMRLGFWDFFVYQGKPGIFFAIEIGALASLLILAYCFRRYKGGRPETQKQTARSWVPTVLLVVLIVGLSCASAIDRDFRWFAGTFTLAVAAAGLLWYAVFARWGKTTGLLRSLDWDTTFFLVGVFVLVGALADSGWMDSLAGFLGNLTGNSLVGAYLLIVFFAVAVSAFVDNTPFLLVMIPVAQKMAAHLGAPVPLLLFGLLIGACLGGNIAPIGASANVVARGILRKQGYTVSFREFMKVSVPFTAAAVLAGCLFVWFVWNSP